MSGIEYALQTFSNPEYSPTQKLMTLVVAIRPQHWGDAAEVEERLHFLCLLLERNSSYQQGLRTALMELLENSRQISLYAESGILPNSGFFSEISRRISHQLLPDMIDDRYLKDILGQIFSQEDDFRWLAQVPLSQWKILYAALHLSRFSVRETLKCTRREMLEAVQVLSYRLAAIGIDPELLRNEPTLEEFESPFLTQNAEVLAYLENYKAWLIDSDHPLHDARHIAVLLEQCRDALIKVRRTASQRGTSITLTFKMRRLEQNMARIEALIALLDDWRSADGSEALFMRSIALLVELVREENRKNNLRDHLRQTLDLIALRVTENASRTGEHYITESRSEYFSMFKSALGGGLVIGFMALLKLYCAKLHLAPLNEAFVFSMNYALGFMLIHILGFTVATKQPAMTAAAIAASIEEVGGTSRSLDNLVSLIARTMRSQVVAILGNIGMVIPVAMLLGYSIHLIGGEHFINAEKAEYLLTSITPFGMTLVYAAIAGICLFLAGQIAGYYDNLCVYNRIPERLQQLSWLQRMLGKARLARVAAYVENNLGALAGNFYFGLLLGGAAAIGILFGAPVDVRHVTLSGAYWGFSLVALDFHLPWQSALIAMIGMLLIGLINLAMSFTLALIVALKARQISFEQGGRHLLYKVLRRFWQSPREFLLPPR